jgi:hypothetical protein
MQGPSKRSPHARNVQSALQAARTASEPHTRAAAALTQALRTRSFAAKGSAGSDGVDRVLVITPAGAGLAEQFRVAGNRNPWFWWSGKPLCPGEDIRIAADTIRAHAGNPHVLTPEWRRVIVTGNK